MYRRQCGCGCCGLSVHAHVWVAAQDSVGRDRRVWAGGGLQVRYLLSWAALQGHRPEQQQRRSIELWLSASEFLDRVAALIPPPRKHRHRYFGVLAPNSPWRALLAQAGRTPGAGSKASRPKTVRADFGATRTGHPARYLCAQLLARIYGVFAFKCSGWGGRGRLVGLIT